MNEQAFFAAGAVFVVALGMVMTRVGREMGGGLWAASWACLYLGGLAATLSPTQA